ncbi:MAG TPA: sugar-binding domain-containing protein, partial [Abditibacteriaceae bacterium]
ILEEARKRNIARVVVDLPKGTRYLRDLERDLKEEFGLREAIVVLGFARSQKTLEGLSEAQIDLQKSEGTEAVRSDLANQAGKCISRKLTNKSKVVVGSGRLVRATINRIHTQLLEDLDIFPMSGFVGEKYYPSSAFSNALELMGITRGNFYILPTPGVVSSTWKKHFVNFDKIPSLQATFQSIREESTILITGIGAFDSKKRETFINYNFANDQEMELFLSNQEKLSRLPAAEICSWLLDVHGNEIQAPWQTIGIDLQTIKTRVKDKSLEVVAVAGGDENRVAAIFAALKGGYVSSLVTDSVTAYQLLDANAGAELTLPTIWSHKRQTP